MSLSAYLTSAPVRILQLVDAPQVPGRNADIFNSLLLARSGLSCMCWQLARSEGLRGVFPQAWCSSLCELNCCAQSCLLPLQKKYFSDFITVDEGALPAGGPK